MRKNDGGVKAASRLGPVVAIAVAVLSLTAAGPAIATTENFGQGVYKCGQAMLPYNIDAKGSITMTMPDGSTMHWRSFGEMVTYMRSHDMC